MTKLEQIAKAMEAAHKASTSYLDLARVAVENTRAPSDDLVSAAYDKTGCTGDNGGHERGWLTEEFDALLDAILNEKPNDQA